MNEQTLAALISSIGTVALAAVVWVRQKGIADEVRYLRVCVAELVHAGEVARIKQLRSDYRPNGVR